MNPARSALFLFLLTFTLLPFSQAEEEAASSILIEPAEGEISIQGSISFSFPKPIVDDSAIAKPGQTCPLTFEPPLPGLFEWKSPTEGLIILNQPLLPGQKYQGKLATGLKDLLGNPVEEPGWAVHYETAPFQVTSEVSPSQRLRARPSIYLEFNYPVKFEELAKHAWFQDRDTREKIPANVTVSSSSTEPLLRGREASVVPQQELSLGKTYDLVLEGVPEADSGRPMPRLYVFQLGTTAPLKTEWLGAFNHVLDEPQIIAKMNDILDPATVTPETVQVEPAIPEMQLTANGDDIVITGKIEPKSVYRITISTQVRGVRGFGLAEPSIWKATARVKSHGIVFPGSELTERSRLGLRFSFLQANTPEVSWKLAKIPMEKLPYVRNRQFEWNREKSDPLRGTPVIDPKTGFVANETTDLLVESLGLQVAGSGTLPAAGEDQEVERTIDWKPTPEQELTGPYLLEVSSKLPDGRVIGNRTVVSFSDLVLTIKHTSGFAVVRATQMADGNAAPDLKIKALRSDGVPLTSATTDANGIALFPWNTLSENNQSVSFYVAETAKGPAMQFANPERAVGYSSQAKPATTTFVSKIVTDRNLYRPGHVVKFKGFARVRDAQGKLTIPMGKKVHWIINRGYNNEAARGAAIVSPDGGWEGEWVVPTAKSIGEYQIKDALEGFNDQRYGGAAFQVEEFRIPLFSVNVVQDPESEVPVIGDKAKFIIRSNYFHGAPNAQATVDWEATWTNNEPWIDEMHTYDEFSQDSKQLQDEVSVKGQVELGNDGTAIVEVPNAFTDGLNRTRVSVAFAADVTSVDGQTIRNGAWQTLQFPKLLAGASASEATQPEQGVAVRASAFDAEDKTSEGARLEVQIFQVNAKTVKEQVAKNVFQYRNTSEYVLVDKREVVSPANYVFPTKATGRFVVVSKLLDVPNAPLASAETFLTGEAPAEVPVQDEVSFALQPDKSNYDVGDVAAIALQSPFAGKAWITVETDEILDSYFLTMKGNSARFDLPIKAEYAPNAMITAYVVKPGGNDALPMERVATTGLSVTRPELVLDVEPVTLKQTVRPGEIVSGQVSVTCAGSPVANTELLVYAVDDAILELGSWSPPNFLSDFYPYRSWSVSTYFALKNYVTGVSRQSLYQKGFILGDKGNFDENPGRKDFKPLAYWNANLRTDHTGLAEFKFQAPDNLTRFRVVAMGQTKKSQFGVGESFVEISKPLMAEPSVPRFLRQQDEVDLRVVIRQNYADDDDILVRCDVGSGLKLTGSPRDTVSTKRDIPSIAKFRVKVSDLAKEVNVRFSAVSKTRPQEMDAVELVIPVLEPEVSRKEAIAAKMPEGGTFKLEDVVPKDWQTGLGTMSVSMSTSPFYPALQGVPRILDYPHGCLEQVSSRILTYSTLGNLLAYLPEVTIQDNNYRQRIAEGLAIYEQSLRENGLLPYWQGGDEPNPFVSAIAAWAASEAVAAGFEVAPELLTKMGAGLKSVAIGTVPTVPENRCFALFALGQLGGYSEDAEIGEAARALYLNREALSNESRAVLALAFEKFGILEDEKQQLLGEIGARKGVNVAAFDPRTFASPDRSDAICWLAMIEAGGQEFEARRTEIREGLLKLMAKSSVLSTQENLWLLIAFRATLKAEKPKTIDDLALTGKRGEISRNGATVMWTDLDLAQWKTFSLKSASSVASYVLNAEYHTGKLQTERVDHGFRVERLVQNLSAAERVGTPAAPYRLGDQLLVTYRVVSKAAQYYVALEDLLPAGLEAVNWNLPQIAKFYTVPTEVGTEQLLLSHAELADAAVRLYFDQFPSGTGTYSILARATAEGKFIWPATQISPMYDARFSGLGASAECVVGGK